ncbi:RUS family member 1-like [Babylonia areolata]|uniref:RUS family member 1-like n=1 Tax=Babylonia areolata TaxID=304850 RepID=UPI003FD46149
MYGDHMNETGTGVVCKEQYGCTSLKRHYVRSDTGRLFAEDRSPRHTSLRQVFRTVFLPQGYPESVSEDYAQYQIWDTVQAFASSLSGALATHSLLHGMGVGDESATVLAATVTWLLKSGTGMVGSIVFAWMKGAQLDCDAKRWRLFADVLNDFALCLEIVAPLTQPYFRLVVCVAGVCKSLVGVAGGCTRAALTQHQARRNNMADVSAKDGSQETLVNLAALLTSFAVLPLVSGHLFLTWTLFLLLTMLHIFANYRAVKAVCMESLNQARLHLLMEHYLLTGAAPAVADVNAREPVFWGLREQWNVHLGASFSSVASNFDSLSQAYSGLSMKYLLNICRQSKKLMIVLSPEAQMCDQLQACVHAELLKFVLSGQQVSREVSKAMQVHLSVGDDCHVMRQSCEATQALFHHLQGELKAKGWNQDHCLLGADEWRSTWDFNSLASRKDV